MDNGIIRIGARTIDKLAQLFCIPYTAVRELASIPEQLFLYKLEKIIKCIEELNKKDYRDREKLNKKANKICKSDAINIMDLINKIEFSEKTDYLAKTIYLYIWSVITREEFFRYSNILEVMLIEDLKLFKKYMVNRKDIQLAKGEFACTLEKLNLFIEYSEGFSMGSIVSKEIIEYGIESIKTYCPTKLGVDFYNKIIKE